MDRKEKIIEQELLTLGVYYHELPDKTRTLLLEAEELFEQRKLEYDEAQKCASAIKYNVKEFCHHKEIARSTIYKKNSSGDSLYDVVVNFINSRASQFIDHKRQTYKDLLNQESFDTVLLNQLLEHEVEHQQMKSALADRNRTIKKLQEEVNDLEKQLAQLRSNPTYIN